jgi:hypothetical protein
MTIIAYDGRNQIKRVCIDKQMTIGDRVASCYKHVITDRGELIAATGSADLGNARKNWYATGANPDTFPKPANDKDSTYLVVFPISGNPIVYCDYPSPVENTDAIQAFGSGCEMAIGAMATGATAAEALESFIPYSSSCGLGYCEFENDGTGWHKVSEKTCKFIFE